MKFISVDIEVDQPSKRLIQIGAAAFDTDNLRFRLDFNKYVNVQNINWTYMKDILPYGQDLIDKQGVSEKEVVDSFWKWLKDISMGKRYVQWGRGDMEFIINLSNNSPDYIQQNFFNIIDVKQIYKNLYQPAMRLPAEHGLGQACRNTLGEFKFVQHDGWNDAYNTGLLYMKMFQDLQQFRKIKEVLNNNNI